MYDLIIIGSGPAGLTASIYASCFHLNHVVIGKVLGGQMSLAHNIINYPGFERYRRGLCGAGICGIGRALLEKRSARSYHRDHARDRDSASCPRVSRGYHLSDPGRF